MKTRPIIFGAEMVRAILRGDKTQTRRVVSPMRNELHSLDDWCERSRTASPQSRQYISALCCPYGYIGSPLWVREGYKIAAFGRSLPLLSGAYSADGTLFEDVTLPPDSWAKFQARKYKFRGQPGRFMYQALSRITLEITDVRIERVQDITSADIIAEGISQTLKDGGIGRMKKPDELRFDFMCLWDKINGGREGGEYSFYKNPWVWVVEFKRVEGDDR